ncbi:MAG: 2Fe-2S ferredoxin [Planctomycetaceae bacterium]|nr:2Fe-2S ferredoxin [Planctomycetaceae bacterium]
MPGQNAHKTVDQATVPVRYVMEDPESLGMTQHEIETRGSAGENLLDIALDHGIEVEHACGGVCACSTCHVYVTEGMEHLSEAEEDEEDRVEEAPGLQANSRLSCQCRIMGDGPIVVKIPAWNRNAVKEAPH